MKNLRYIKDFIAENKYRYLLGVLCLIVVDVLQLVLPWLIGNLTDQLEAGQLNKARVLQYALIIVAMAAGIASFRFFWRYLILGVSKKVEAKLRERFYAHLQKLGAFYYNNHKTGDLMAHATNDIGNITMATGMGVIISIDSALIPVAATAMMIKTARNPAHPGLLRTSRIIDSLRFAAGEKHGVPYNKYAGSFFSNDRDRKGKFSPVYG